MSQNKRLTWVDLTFFYTKFQSEDVYNHFQSVAVSWLVFISFSHGKLKTRYKNMKHFNDFFVSNNSLLFTTTLCVWSNYLSHPFDKWLDLNMCIQYVHSFKIDICLSIKSLLFFQTWAWKDMNTSGSIRCDGAMRGYSIVEILVKNTFKCGKKRQSAGKRRQSAGKRWRIAGLRWHKSEWRKPLCEGFQKVGAEDLFCAAHFWKPEKLLSWIEQVLKKCNERPFGSSRLRLRSNSPWCIFKFDDNLCHVYVCNTHCALQIR